MKLASGDSNPVDSVPERSSDFLSGTNTAAAVNPQPNIRSTAGTNRKTNTTTDNMKTSTLIVL
jgi:hypothetical protein